MPPPRPPSRIEPLAFPVFGLSWWSDPAEGGRSIIAYCGGGGSAKTGVNNSVVIFGERNGPRQISTGEAVGVALKIYQNPISQNLWLLVALGNEVRRYPIEADENGNDGETSQVVPMGEESCVAVAANSMCTRVALGCESGKVLVFESSDAEFTTSTSPLYTLNGHQKAVCALDFASRTVERLMSSAKDGTACIADGGQLISGLRCSVTDPSQPKPKRPPQIMVRGCAFLDLEGLFAVTVASARRGKAFLSQWEEQTDEKGQRRFVCVSKTPCSDCPISAMSLSADLSLLVLGSVEGSIILWNVETWRPIKTFPEVHHLPVTCIAARPFYSLHAPIQGELEDEVLIHARSASADSQLGCLTAQRRGKKKRPGGEDSSIFSCSTLIWLIHEILILTILGMILSPIYDEAKEKCGHIGIIELPECVLHEVLFAPSYRAGITSPPY